MPLAMGQIHILIHFGWLCRIVQKIKGKMPYIVELNDPVTLFNLKHVTRHWYFTSMCDGQLSSACDVWVWQWHRALYTYKCLRIVDRVQTNVLQPTNAKILDPFQEHLQSGRYHGQEVCGAKKQQNTRWRNTWGRQNVDNATYYSKCW